MIETISIAIATNQNKTYEWRVIDKLVLKRLFTMMRNLEWLSKLFDRVPCDESVFPIEDILSPNSAFPLHGTS